MKREPPEPAQRARQALDRAAAELFTAAASDRAPLALRAALLARAQREAGETTTQGALRSAAGGNVQALPVRSGASPTSRATDSWRALDRWRNVPRLWLALGAAAALVVAVVGWSAWREMPPEAPLISAERVPAREPRRARNESVEQPAPAALEGVAMPRAGEAGDSSGRTRTTPSHPGRGSAVRAAPATPRDATRQVAPSPAPFVEPSPAPPSEAPQTTPVGPSIAVQLAQLEQIRGALRAGAPARALALLDEYERASQGGEFSAEARLMRIEALAGARRTPEARALAEDFLSRYPNSPLADRARRIAEGSAPGVR